MKFKDADFLRRAGVAVRIPAPPGSLVCASGGRPGTCRSEVKYRIGAEEIPALREALGRLLAPDPHGGAYKVSTLYFSSGRFRLRYYNWDTARLRLECKERIGGMSRKEGIMTDPGEMSRLLSGEPSGVPLADDFARRAREDGLAPSLAVIYRREAWESRGIRTTIDTDLRSGEVRSLAAFLAGPELSPAGPDAFLEVKSRGRVPESVREALGLGFREPCRLSKYLSAENGVDRPPEI